MKSSQQTLQSSMEETKKIMTLPPIQKAKYFKELNQCSRRFYQLLQYQDEALLNQLNLYVCTGEIKNPNALILPHFVAGPLLPPNMVRTFLIGDYFKNKEEPFYEEDALWKNWLN